MLVDIVKILIGFVFLLWSADKLVASSSALAARLGLSPLIIGLTIVAFGTSAPEILVSSVASFKGSPEIAIGNAFGSNVANIGLVLGTTLLFGSITLHKDAILSEIPYLVAITLIMSIFIALFGINVWLGNLALALIVWYMLWLIRKVKTQNGDNAILAEEYNEEIPSTMATKWIAIWLITSLIILPLSADVLVEGAKGVAQTLGISDAIIGITIVAIGTSLPELITSITSIFKGEQGIALGNIVGSNIFNLTVVLIPVGWISDVNISDVNLITRDIAVMLLFTLILSSRVWFFRAHSILSRQFGVSLLGLYIGYMALLVWQST